MRLPDTANELYVPAPKRRPWIRVHVWSVLGALLLIAGVSGSVLAANGVSRGQVQKSQKAFSSSSQQIAATLQLSVQHEYDLISSASAFVTGEPNATEAQFALWAQAVGAMQRYPELQGIGTARIIPPSGLAAFSALPGPEAATGPTTREPFVLIPPGARPFYCLTSIGLNRSEKVGLPRGFDLCAGPQGAAILKARASGQDDLQPLTVRGVTTLSFAVPIYRTGVIPATLSLRLHDFVGWVGMSIVPDVILDTALRGHDGIAVSLRFAGVATGSFQSGIKPRDAWIDTIGLPGGGIIRTYGPINQSGPFSDPSSRMLMLGGVAFSLLLAALIYLLGTGRARAIAAVNDRTAELRFQALHDSLTELPNRELILDRIDQMLARCRRSHLPIATMFLDLDDFKDINDTLGHLAGDQLLTAVGARLAGAMREGDTVGRLGGDEFVLLVEGDSLSAGVETVAERILAILEPPFEIEASEFPLAISASIGVATGLRPAPEDLLRDSDIALYRAKAAGKRCSIVFESEMQTAALDHRQLGVDLRTALQDNQFFLLYQPTIDLQTSAFTGVEALLRWNHPTRGVVGPDEFIPSLESSGLILPVGAWVLEQACLQGARWHSFGHRFTVSVNVSAKQLSLDRIANDVEHALTLSGFDARYLILELTETTLMKDVEETINRLQHLKSLGLRIAVDDFGTGYSSLAYLRQFPIDVLKIDRGFVTGLSNTAEAAALVHTLVQLGKALDLETIAEGIEDDDQRLRLQAEHVDTGQGFLFSRPIDVAAVDRFLERFATGSGTAIDEVPVPLSELPV